MNDVEVFVADEQTAEPVDTRRWARLAREVLAAEGVRGEAELSMLFVDEPSMAELNRKFNGEERPTDVLAFPIDDDAFEPGRFPDSGGTGPGDGPEPTDLPLMLGDVVVCPTVARRGAEAHGWAYEDEVALLVVHGILHLLGMDHADPAEAQAMDRRQRELLDRFHRR